MTSVTVAARRDASSRSIWLRSPVGIYSAYHRMVVTGFECPICVATYVTTSGSSTSTTATSARAGS